MSIGLGISLWGTFGVASNPNLINPDPSTWDTKVNVTIGGDASGYTVTATTTAVTLLLLTGAATATAAGLTYSGYIKKGNAATGAGYFGIYDGTSSSVLKEGNINLDTGVWTGSAGVTVSDAGSGWWKLVAPVSPTVGHTVNIYACFSGASRTAGTFAYVRNLKIERGLVAT